MGFSLNPYLIARFGIREFFLKSLLEIQQGLKLAMSFSLAFHLWLKPPDQGNSPILASHRRMSIFTYHLFSLFMCQNFFSVPVGNSKGTKTSNFPLTSVPSIGIKTLRGSSPFLANQTENSIFSKKM